MTSLTYLHFSKRHTRRLKFIVIASLPLMLTTRINTTPPRADAAVEAIAYMSKNGLIMDQARWHEVVTSTDHGHKIHSLKALNQALQVGNYHTDVVKDLQQTEDVHYPSVTHVQGLSLINVPSFYSQSARKQRRYVKHLDQLIQHSHGTVYLNLVNNSGGLSAAMVAGLASLIPDGRLWTEVDRHGHQYPAKLTHGYYRQLGGRLSLATAGSPKQLQRQVVVLMNAGTASAAEFSILALKRNPRCTLVGVPTSGCTSANTWHVVGRQHWYGSFTTRSIINSVPVHGRKHFSNDQIQPDVWTTRVPTLPADYRSQTTFNPGFIQEVRRISPKADQPAQRPTS